MKDTDKAGYKMSGVIQVVEETRDDLIHGREEQTQERAVKQEKRAELFGDGEDTVAVRGCDKLKGHGGGAFDGIESTAGRTKAAAATEGDKLGLSTLRAAVKSSAERRIAAVDHLLDVFHFNIARMASVFNFFEMITKDLLQNVHR